MSNNNYQRYQREQQFNIVPASTNNFYNQGPPPLQGPRLQGYYDATNEIDENNRRGRRGPGSVYSRGSRSSKWSRAGPGATGRTYARHLRKKLSDLMKPAQPAAQPPPAAPGTSAPPTAPPAASVPPVQLSIDQLYSKLKEAASAKPQGQEKTWNDEVTNSKECKKTGSTEAITKAVPQYRLAINRQRPAYGAIKAVARALRQCTPSQDSEERQVLHYMLAKLYRIMGDRRQSSLHATLWLSKYGYTGKRLAPGQFNVPMNALEMVSDLDLFRIEKVAKLVKKRLTSKKGAKRLVQDEQTITGEQNKLKSALYWQASIDYDGMDKEQLNGAVKRGQKLYDLWDRAVRINALTYKNGLPKWKFIKNKSDKTMDGAERNRKRKQEIEARVQELQNARVEPVPNPTLALPNTGGGGQAPQGPRIWNSNKITILDDDFAGYACAATNYKRNTVVLTESAIAFHWTRGQFCGRCHKRVEEGAFQPCAVCTRTVFCSAECRAMKSHNPAMCSGFKWRNVLSNRGHLIYQLVDYCGGVDKFARLWSKGEAFSKLNPGQMKAWPLIAVKLLFGRQVNKLFAAERGSDGLQAAPSDLNVDGTRKTRAQMNAERKAKQGQTQQYNLTTLVEAFQTVSILVATYPNVPDQLALLEMVYYLLRFMAVHCTGKEQIQTGGGGGGGSGGSTFRSKRRSTAGSTVSGFSSHSGKSRGSNFTGGSRSRSMMLKGSSKSYGGYALGAFSGLLRPSCDNNLRRRLNHKGMIEYVATREIVNTEPLTLSFGANMAKYPKGVKRKQEIIKRFGFECACRDCRNTNIIPGSSTAPATPPSDTSNSSNPSNSA